MAADLCWLIVIFMLRVAWLAGTWHRRQPQGGPAAVHATVQRCLRPRTPDDCPACRQASTRSTVVTPARLPPPPWREVKRQRGAPKRIATHGFACPAPSCTYYRITDAQIHALVGDGTHGQHERIQTFTQIPLANAIQERFLTSHLFLSTRRRV